MSDKFKDYGVSTIIAIDDDFREIKDDDLLSDFSEDTIEFLTDYRSNEFSKYTVKEYSEKVDSDFKHKLSIEINARDKYSCFKPTDITFKAISANLEQIKETIEGIDGRDKSRKHLILLDRTLQEDAGGAIIDNLFIDVLKFIHSKIREKNLLLLIYSNDDTPEELNSFEGAKEYLRSLGLDESVAEQLVLHFNYVQKTEALSSDFFDNILKSQKANYISEYKNIFEESYSKLTERLWQLNQNQVLFYYDYINEGQHVDSIIYETFLTKFKQVYSDTFSEKNNHKELINPIRRSMQQSVQSVQKKSKILRFLKELDLGLTFNDRLRKISASTDISFGDVIKIGAKKYLIVSQDCDMTIRDDDNRRLSYIQLVEIEDASEIVTEKLLSKKLKNLGSNVGIDDPIVKEALKRYGLSQDSINRVVNRQTPTDKLGTNQINDLVLYNDFKETNDFKIYLIDCIWLDALLLKSSDNRIILSEQNISNSHEIRYATRNYLKNKFRELIDRIGEDSSQDVVDKIVKYIFEDIAIECEGIFSDNGGTGKTKLTGFTLKNIERIGRLDRLDAMKIFKSIVDHEGRIPDIRIPLI